MTNREQRIADIERLAAEEGITLPWPAAVIASLEEQGHVVDLTTGLVVQGAAEQRVSLTVLGEAVAVANKRWGGEL
ncbi:MAG TPA: hypothetical protein PKA43_00260 [Candidatus Competibacter phosphatis]|nr:hypothetical protein [Candidatus Competibacter phosphatis]